MRVGLNRKRPLLLDISRLLSRVESGAWSGIDRVEAAYLERFCNEDRPVFGLCRFAGADHLFDRNGLERMRAVLIGGRRSGRPRNPAIKTPDSVPCIQSLIDEASLARPGRFRLRGMITDRVPNDAIYFNVGHSNQRDRVFRALKNRGTRQIRVLVHDAIPLDHSDTQTPQSRRSARRRLACISRHAELIIYPSECSRASVERHLKYLGRCPPSCVAPLGIDVAAPAISAPHGLGDGRRFFVALGTIEPRKNVGFLLDLWEKLPRDDPRFWLVVVGRRGWMTQSVCARLDRMIADGFPIVEVNDADDAGVSWILSHARGLLFPSRAEGFGFPPAEAVALGTPAVCNDLAVLREFLGDTPIYRPLSDSAGWIAEIRRLGTPAQPMRIEPPKLPDWDAHFNMVLNSDC